MESYKLLEADFVSEEMSGQDPDVPLIRFTVAPPIKFTDRFPIQMALSEGVEDLAVSHPGSRIIRDIADSHRIRVDDNDDGSSSTLNFELSGTRKDRVIYNEGIRSMLRVIVEGALNDD